MIPAVVSTLRAGPRQQVLVLLARNDAAALHALGMPSRGALDHARRFRHEARHRASLIATALLETGLRSILSDPAAAEQLRLRPSRRPLHDASPDVQLALSTSHTDAWVGAALLPGAGSGRRVGIDLEPAGRPIHPRIAERLPMHLREADSLTAWTLTEAALKADGRGVPGLAHLESIAARERTGRVLLRMSSAPNHRILAMPLEGLPPELRGAIAIAR